MIAAILHQLTRNLSEEEIANSPFATYFVDHTTGLYPIAASGVPFDMKYVGIKGDVIADLHEDLAAEQKARVTYDNILRLCDDPDVKDPIKFLREREIVHYQRFADTILTVSNRNDSKRNTAKAIFQRDALAIFISNIPYEKTLAWIYRLSNASFLYPVCFSRTTPLLNHTGMLLIPVVVDAD